MQKLSKEFLEEKVTSIKSYGVGKNAAESSKFDSNANVEKSNTATRSNELLKDVYIQINRCMLQARVQELFGEEVSKQYIHDLESHLLYTHDETSLFPYCVSANMYPFLTDGLTKLGGESEAPHNLQSFCGSFINLVFAISSQFAGAVATVEFLMYFEHFIKKEYGDDWFNNLDQIVSVGVNSRTMKEVIEQHLQGIVYTINQPAAARGYQSVFWNISLFDEYYFKSLFGDFCFPDDDMTSPTWEGVDAIQKLFLSWFNKEREKKVLTFPVVTAALLTENGKTKDDNFTRFLSKEMSEGNTFFVYMSDSADSLASCCFSKEEIILIKDSNNGIMLTTFEKYKNMNTKERKNTTVFHDGNWCSAKLIKVPRKNRKMYSVETVNKKKSICTEDHIFPTLNGDKRVKDLTTDDYLMINNSGIEFDVDKSEEYNRMRGLLIGAYLGDGSIYRRKNCDSVDINLSLNEDKVKILKDMLDFYGFKIYNKTESNVVPCKTTSKEVEKIIREFVSGDYSYNKNLDLNVLKYSYEFRNGILDGYYITDGGNSNRIYSTSFNLIKSIEAMITSMGKTSVIDCHDKTGDKGVIRGVEFNRNYPLYCIRWYESFNKRDYKDMFVKRNGQLFYKISEIKETDYDDEYVYCFEMKNQKEPYFTLPNGIITHNCRLRNEVNDTSFSYSLGAGGVATGSVNVMTLNVNRFIQENGMDKLKLKEVISRIHKYQIAYRSLIQDDLNNGMLTVYDAGFISLDKQFCTIGINGFVEAAEYLGIEISPNEKYFEFCKEFLGTIYKKNREITKLTGIKFNTEFVPAENLGVKNAKWDRESGLHVSRDVYNSYFYVVEDEKTNPLDKFMLHGKDVIQYLDGGSALHLNLDVPLPEDKYYGLFQIAATSGANYWTVNVKSTICNDCGHIEKQPHPSCVKCGSSDVDGATRVIGYIKRISSFSNARQKEEHKRFYSKEQK